MPACQRAKKTTMAASTLAVALLAMMASPANASIYEHAGKGFCLDAAETDYSYILKAGGVSTYPACSVECDDANLLLANAAQTYRGFSHIRTQFQGATGTIPRQSCMCHYDNAGLPDVLPVELQEGWILAGGGAGNGAVSGSDGSNGIACYDILVEDASNPASDVPEVILAGYQ